MKNLCFAMSFIFLLFSDLYSQSEAERTYHPLSGAIGISAEGGLTISQTDYSKSNFGYIAKGSFEYFFPSSSIGAFGLKLMGGIGTIAGDNGSRAFQPGVFKFKTSLGMFGAGAEYTLNFGVVNPYLLAGAYYISFDPKDNSGNKLRRNSIAAYNTSEPNYTGEAGIKFLLSRNLSLNISGAAYISPNDNLDDYAVGKAKDTYFSLAAGITYFIQSTKDSDNDGVEDSEDMCPDTQPGVKVDEYGCPVDSDKDGVPDYLDKCPDTPDKVAVNFEGCPIDSDNDGVPDYLDSCPNTPPHVKVDKNGCPIDSDKDGIPDYEDKCPGTPLGTKVDQSGCEVVGEAPAKEVKKFVLNGTANFEFGSTKLTDNAKKVLFDIIKVIKDNPNSHWRIEGYTDNVGSYEGNKKISLERAKEVLAIFLSNGLSKDRFEIYGMGPDNPIGDNKTDFGRSLNRRVEIKNTGKIEYSVPEQNNVPSEGKNYDYSKDEIVDNTIFTDGKLFMVQVSSWKTKAKAEKEMLKLKNKGYDAVIFKSSLPDKNVTIYRVRIGFFGSKEEAQEFIEKHFGVK
jgi:OmpA-OmpF porin, OOP family